MKTVVVVSSLLLALSTLADAGQSSQKIEIKGMSVGMSRSAVEVIIGTSGSAKRKKFTIGGVASGSEFGTQTKFDNGKLVDLFFRFNPEQFDDVRDAVKAKYPDLRCAKSALQNNFGAKFSQESCTLDGPDSQLRLERYASRVTDGYLMLSQKLDLQKLQSQKKANASDI